MKKRGKEMDAKEYLQNFLKMTESKFTSLNGVPVTSIRLSREEWVELHAIINSLLKDGVR